MDYGQVENLEYPYDCCEKDAEEITQLIKKYEHLLKEGFLVFLAKGRSMSYGRWAWLIVRKAFNPHKYYDLPIGRFEFELKRSMSKYLRTC
ncbi:hypothetical protein H0A36_29690 [Endozoicomonas sp. SM1973]|uniref:Uncharacterized protein n=1 Tax=Spartinivicinus marinus TaxID=2994442 RepID=A0A853ILI0_9GAMM|nr:hypothetical protein [Spartinivicinus marinus]MCX4027356.1 hypothetical protein [Spartinivicinus marinus]NYZ70187.1 hypothetical protein [Spartinivicinus marinus]